MGANPTLLYSDCAALRWMLTLFLIRAEVAALSFKFGAHSGAEDSLASPHVI